MECTSGSSPWLTKVPAVLILVTSLCKLDSRRFRELISVITADLKALSLKQADTSRAVFVFLCLTGKRLFQCSMFNVQCFIREALQGARAYSKQITQKHTNRIQTTKSGVYTNYKFRHKKAYCEITVLD